MTTCWCLTIITTWLRVDVLLSSHMTTCWCLTIITHDYVLMSYYHHTWLRQDFVIMYIAWIKITVQINSNRNFHAGWEYIVNFNVQFSIGCKHIWTYYMHFFLYYMCAYYGGPLYVGIMVIKFSVDWGLVLAGVDALRDQLVGFIM